MKGALFDLGDHCSKRLLIVVHHLAVDGVSWRILMDDLGTFYAQLASGGQVAPQPKTTSFAEWSDRLERYARSARLTAEADYWAKPRSIRPLPVDRNEGANTVGSERELTVALTAQETASLLRDVPQAFRTQINDVLLTALAVTLRRWTGHESIVVDLEGHGREELFPDVDLSRTVGWFTSIFPVELMAPSATDIVGTLQSIKRVLHKLPRKGIGFGIVRYLGETEVRDRLAVLPTPQVSFNYLGQFEHGLPSLGRYASELDLSGAPISDRAVRSHLLQIDSQVQAGVFSVNFFYSVNLHDESTVRRLAQGFIEAIGEILLAATESGRELVDVSDFPLAGLDQADLDRIVGTDDY